MQLDTRLPLAAVGERINPAGIMQQAAKFRQQQQANALKQRLEELKASREAETLERRQRAGRRVYSQMQQVERGTPAQYEPAPMNQGQVINQPFDGQMRESSPAVPSREMSPEEINAAMVRELFAEGDYEGAFEAMKAARTGQASQAKPFGAQTKRGPDGMEYALNMMTGRYEPTGFAAEPEQPKKNIVLKETARGIEAVDMANIKPGTILPPPVAEKKPDISPYQRIQVESGLRDDYRADSKNYTEIKRQSAIIKAALSDPSAAGTLSAATAYMKMLDPESVVRESELGMAMNNQGLIDRLKSYWTTIEMGKVLTPTQKADFARLSDMYLKSAEEAQINLNTRYSDLSTGAGVDPRRVVMYDVRPSTQAKPKSRDIGTAAQWLKSRKIRTQQQLSTEVGKLKKSGWTDDEIRKATAAAGL